MLPSANVTAVILTRGDVDLTPILDSLIFDDVVVWNNAAEAEDQMTFGRTLAIKRARHRVIYSQDDDIVHPPENQMRLLAEYQQGVLTGCMWPEWSDGARRQGIPGGYDDLVFPGSGAVYDAWIPGEASLRYLNAYPFDDFFRLWSDTIVGVLAETRQIDLRFDELPWAAGPGRMASLPNNAELKGEAIRRAREVRDREPVAA